MSDLGRAFVQIVPSAHGIAGSIADVLSGEAASAGHAAGLNIAGAIKGAILAAGIGTAVKDALTAGMNFDAEMAHVAAVSGATGAELDQLRDKALEMGAKTKFSASESAAALSYMGMAGWTAQQMLDGIEGIMSLAAADGLDLATTSDIVTDALTAFGLTAADSSHFADVLAVASSSANTNVALMGETFKYVGTIAGGLGVSIEDTAEAIGLMANAGIKSTQAGTELRAILTRLATNAGASSKSLGALDVLVDALGVQFYDANGDVRDFTDILAEARVAWAGLGMAQQASYGKIIAGQEALSGWLALMNAAPADIAKLSDAIANADGTAERMGEIMQNNLPGAITIFKSAVEGLQVAVYDNFSEPLQQAVEAATGFVGSLTQAIRSGDTDSFLEAAAEIAGSLFNGFMEAIPQVTQIGVQIIDNIASGLAEGIPNFLQNALPMLEELSGTIRENAGKLIDSGINLLLNLAKGFADSIPTLIEHVPTIISNIAGVINDNAPKIIAAGIQIIITLAAGIIKSIPTLIENFPKIVKAIFDVITAVNWVSLGKSIITGIANGVKKLITSIPDAIRNMVRSAHDIITLWDWKTLGEYILICIRDGITGFLGNIKSAFTSMIGHIQSIWTNHNWTQLGIDIVKGIISGITGKIREAVDTVRNLAARMFGGAQEELDSHSPSRKFEWLGETAPSGLAVGIENNLNPVRRAMDELMAEVSAPVLNPVLVSGYAYSAALDSAFPAAASQYGGGTSGDELVEALQKALSGMGVYMNGQRVGALIQKQIRDNIRATGNGYVLV